MKPIRLSASEWKLMECLWDESPRTITQLVHALEPETGWAKATIITMLSRLEAKGAVSWQTAGRARQYSPAVTREAASCRGNPQLPRQGLSWLGWTAGERHGRRKRAQRRGHR